MSRDGSGNYSLPTGNPVVSGDTISASTHNTTMSDIAAALTASIAKDGQTTPTANLPMGGYKHTGVASAAARDQYCTAANAQDNTFDYLTSVSGADTITATAAISMSAYAAGQCFRFVSAGTNTGAVTININAIGAKAITKNGTTALVAGDIPSGATVEIIYDGTRFQIVNPACAKSGANSDITSLSGLTTALSVAQGGTGKTSATAKSLLVGNGTSALAEIAPGTLNQVLMSDGTDWLAKTILSYNPGAANLSDGNLNFYDSAGALALKVIWGYQASVADGGTVNFHSAFANYCFGVWPVLIYNNNNGANAYNVTKNSFAVYHGSGASLNVSYIAIGK